MKFIKHFHYHSVLLSIGFWLPQAIYLNSRLAHVKVLTHIHYLTILTQHLHRSWHVEYQLCGRLQQISHCGGNPHLHVKDHVTTDLLVGWGELICPHSES
jgi:hypothetical protein